MTVVASNFARKENDLYETEPWATRALLRHLQILLDATVSAPVLRYEGRAGNEAAA